MTSAPTIDAPLAEQTKSVERGPGGRLLPGHAMGRPKGSRNRLNARVLDDLGELTPRALAVLKERLDGGDLKAATYVLDRFLPTERAVPLGTTDPHAVADALADGMLTPTEPGKVATSLKVVADAAEVKELRTRLDEIESLMAAARQ